MANITRPDIANAVREVATHSHNYKKQHWMGVVKTLKYLHAIKDLEPRCSRDADPILSVHVTLHMPLVKRIDGRSQWGAVVYAGATLREIVVDRVRVCSFHCVKKEYF